MMPERVDNGQRSFGIETGVRGSGLDVKDLHAKYGDQAVLHGIDLTVPHGTFTAVLGTNGAGKTTLLNAIAGLHRPILGEIILAGEHLETLPAYAIARAGVCYIPEGRGIFPDLTVGENLKLSIGKSAAALEQYFERFPALSPWLHREAGTLSGGEQQMVAIAPAVVGTYRLLLVDELSMGLAPRLVDDLFEFLSGVKQSQASVILVEQFANRALSLADQAYVVRKGRFVYRGTAAALLDQPEYLQSLYLGEAGDQGMPAQDRTSYPNGEASFVCVETDGQ
jgi:branched-chain amino acid transport system ATP-binding protein